MENAIIAQNIKRYFKAGDGTTVHALDGVSMEIKKGTLAILKRAFRTLERPHFLIFLVRLICRQMEVCSFWIKTSSR